MSEEVMPKKNSVITLALVAVLVLLVAVVVFMYMQRDKDATSPVTAAPDASQGQTGSTPQAGGQMTMTDTAPLDVATATKVPEGMTPAEYLGKYFEACEAKDWETAFTMLPYAKQQSYGTAEKFGAQLEGYGISDHSITVESESDEEVVLLGAMTTGFGPKAYPWQFVQQDGVWYAKFRGEVTFISQ